MDPVQRQHGPSKLDIPYVAEYADVCGGYPVIERMRFPVRIIVEAYRELGDIAKVAELYPQLTQAQIRCALDYYARNPGRVDEDIRRNAMGPCDHAHTRDRPWPV